MCRTLAHINATFLSTVISLTFFRREQTQNAQTYSYKIGRSCKKFSSYVTQTNRIVLDKRLPAPQL